MDVKEVRQYKAALAKRLAGNLPVGAREAYNDVLSSKRVPSAAQAAVLPLLQAVLANWQKRQGFLPSDIEEARSESDPVDKFSVLARTFFLGAREEKVVSGSHGMGDSWAVSVSGSATRYLFPKKLDTLEKLIPWAESYYADGVAALEALIEEQSSETNA